MATRNAGRPASRPFRRPNNAPRAIEACPDRVLLPSCPAGPLSRGATRGLRSARSLTRGPLMARAGCYHEAKVMRIELAHEAGCSKLAAVRANLAWAEWMLPAEALPARAAGEQQ